VAIKIKTIYPTPHDSEIASEDYALNFYPEISFSRTKVRVV